MSLPYFAYGSNLSAAHWADWATARGASPSLLRPLEAAWLPDHRLDFNYYSTTHRAGAANIMAAPGQLVPGFLFEAPPPILAALDAKEGHPNYYARTERTVLTADGRAVRALTYAVVPARRRPFTPPTPVYLDRIRAGYRDRGLAADLGALEAVAAGLPAPALVPGIFVYGTLRSGEALHHHVVRFGVRVAERATAPGRLWSLGWYPGAVFWPPGGGQVVGERVVLVDLAAAVVALDAVEEVAQGEYRRVLVDAGGQRAWAWQVCDVAGHPRIPGGDWVAHRKALRP